LALETTGLFENISASTKGISNRQPVVARDVTSGVDNNFSITGNLVLNK